MTKRKFGMAFAVLAALVMAAALAFMGCDSPTGTGQTGGGETGGGETGGSETGGTGDGGTGGAVVLRTSDGVPVTGINTVATAVAYVNHAAAYAREANEEPETFTLEINQNVYSGTAAALASGADLTIVGIGGRQEIRFTPTSRIERLFTVGAGATLTLGNNITLVGRRDGQNGMTENHLSDLVTISGGGCLYMTYNSMITGHTSAAQGTDNGAGAAVRIVGLDSTLTMRDEAAITGNRHQSTITSGANQYPAGGVFLEHSSGHVTRLFMYDDSSITGNHARADGRAADVTAASGHGQFNTLLEWVTEGRISALQQRNNPGTIHTSP